MTDPTQAAHDRIINLLESYDVKAISRSEYVGSLLALIRERGLEAKIEALEDIERKFRPWDPVVAGRIGLELAALREERGGNDTQ